MQTHAAPSIPLLVPPLKTIPSAKGRPFTGFLPDLRRDKLQTLVDLVARNGDLVRVPVVMNLYLVTHPDDVKHVLQDNHRNYAKGFNYPRLERLLGKGLLTSEGAEHLRNRRLAQPAFHRQRIANFAQLMVRHTEGMVQQFPKEGAFDLHSLLMKFTLSVVAEALFSSDVTAHADEVGAALSRALEITEQRFMSVVVLPAYVPSPQNIRFRRALKILDRLVNDLIETRSREQTPHHDLLAMLMESRTDDTGETLSVGQLRDELMTMVLAGHETTANALTWAFYLLSKHPDVERRLHAEVHSVLAGRNPALADLPRLPYTKQVIEETMRLYPPRGRLDEERSKTMCSQVITYPKALK